MKKFLKFASLCVVICSAASVRAQMSDPMRPPGGGQSAPVGAEAAVSEDAAAGVQAVFIRPGGKSEALVNGQLVRVGGMLGGKKIIRITESEIVLRGEAGRETMKLNPAVEKTAVRPPSPQTKSPRQ